MGKFDETITVLRETSANAVQSLADLEGGRHRRFDQHGETTGGWIAKYRQIIKTSADLIRGYERHND